MTDNKRKPRTPDKVKDSTPKPVDKAALDAYNEERLVSKYDKENLKGKK